jgi:hypothetical protein
VAWPPPFEGEDTAAYDELLARISGAVKPTDIFEEIWVGDIVDLVWEAVRLRRLKTSLMAPTAYNGLEEILKPLVDDRWDRERLVQDWAKREKGAIERVDEFLASAGLTMDEVMAQTLSINLNDIERIQRMIANAEARRNAILREVERHRATWGEDLRRAAQQAEDVEFEIMENKSGKARSAA